MPEEQNSASTITEAFNFNRAGQISHEQLRAIGTVNDLFARNIMHTLSAWLRTNVQAKVVQAKPFSYAEFLQRIKEPAYVCSTRLAPQESLGLLEMDLALASPIINLLLGGDGHTASVRELTDIEGAILSSVIEKIVREFNVAWKPLGLRFAFEKHETAAQIARMMPASEKTLCITFELAMPNAEGTVNLCIPSSVLNAVLREPAAEHDRPRRRSEESEKRMQELVAEVSFGAVLQFPPVRLPARELAAMTPGAVLRLPLPHHSLAELRIAGVVLGKARPMRVGEHRGAQMQISQPEHATPNI